MITISLCMIVKNAEETLARCLDSVKDIVDEINIVDTGSTDKTVKIAKIASIIINGRTVLPKHEMKLLNMRQKIIYSIWMPMMYC